jgi:hypothetical protein
MTSFNSRLPQSSSSSLPPSAPTQRSTRNLFATTLHPGKLPSRTLPVLQLTPPQPSSRRADPRLGLAPTSRRRSQTQDLAPHQLRQNYLRHHRRPRWNHRHCRCIALHSAAPTEPQPLGRHLAHHRPPLHLGPHVQPHSQDAVCAGQRQGRN